MLEVDFINGTSATTGEPVAEGRPCFPVFTVLGTIGLAIFVAISLLRNHHTNTAPAAGGGIELKPSPGGTPDQTTPLSINNWAASTNSSPPLLATQPPWWP